MNAYFNNVLVYGVGSRLDVILETPFALELDSSAVDVYANNDKVLQIEHDGGWVDVVAKELGTSTIRIMNGTEVIKDVTIEVKTSIARPATVLNSSFNEPEPK